MRQNNRNTESIYILLYSDLLLLYDTVHCSIDAPKIVMNHISVYICRLAGSSAHMHAWWTGGLGPLK